MIEDGTAIGDGIASAVNRLRESKRAQQGDRAAHRRDQQPGGARPGGRGARGARPRDPDPRRGRGGARPGARPGAGALRRDPVRPAGVGIDEASLTAIADATGGRYFRAADFAALEEVYATIDRMETHAGRRQGVHALRGAVRALRAPRARPPRPREGAGARPPREAAVIQLGRARVPALAAGAAAAGRAAPLPGAAPGAAPAAPPRRRGARAPGSRSAGARRRWPVSPSCSSRSSSCSSPWPARSGASAGSRSGGGGWTSSSCSTPPTACARRTCGRTGCSGRSGASATCSRGSRATASAWWRSPARASSRAR